MTEPQRDTEFSPHAFRRALGNFATGVTIVTARSPEGETIGVTASSFNSLSMDPPLVLWSSMKNSRSCAIFESASHFAVNILASDQMEMSNHFARQQEDKFAGVEWEEGVGGAPIFPNCAGRFQCESYDKLDGGDHWIFVGKVVAFDDFGRPPLCFHQGSYSMVFGHPGSAPKADNGTLADDYKGPMGNLIFFQMLQAVRSYQAKYSPKLETLDLSLIEARTLLVLKHLPRVQAEGLVGHLNAPLPEAREALINLTDRGFVAANDAGYALTDPGLLKSEECWKLAQNHEVQAFSEFSPEDVKTFTTVLQGLMAQ